MGYETKLYIGTATIMEGENYFSEIASIDLCKVCYNEMGKLIEEMQACTSPKMEFVAVKNELGDNSSKFCPELNGFLYVKMNISGQEEPVEEDLYGNKLVLVPAERVLYAMRLDNSKEPYRRFPPAIALLETLTEYFKEPLYCVLYGH